MEIQLKYSQLEGRKILIVTLALGVLIGTFPFLKGDFWNANAELEGSVLDLPELTIYQENSLAPFSSPINPEPEVVKKVRVVITAYSSSVWETDNTPHITAAGTWVRDGIVANNLLPFGTKIRIPELYGEKIFIVEDRMSWEKGNYHFDIWFPDYWQALDFGAKRTYIEILES